MRLNGGKGCVAKLREVSYYRKLVSLPPISPCGVNLNKETHCIEAYP